MALRMVQVTRVRTHGIGLASIAREHSIGIFMGSRGFLLKSGVFFPQNIFDIFRLIRTLFTSTRLFARTAYSKCYSLLF